MDDRDDTMSRENKALSGMSPEELFSFLSLDKPFRARQISNGSPTARGISIP